MRGKRTLLLISAGSIAAAGILIALVNIPLTSSATVGFLRKASFGQVILSVTVINPLVPESHPSVGQVSTNMGGGSGGGSIVSQVNTGISANYKPTAIDKTVSTVLPTKPAESAFAPMPSAFGQAPSVPASVSAPQNKIPSRQTAPVKALLPSTPTVAPQNTSRDRGTSAAPKVPIIVQRVVQSGATVVRELLKTLQSVGSLFKFNSAPTTNQPSPTTTAKPTSKDPASRGVSKPTTPSPSKAETKATPPNPSRKTSTTKPEVTPAKVSTTTQKSLLGNAASAILFWFDSLFQ